MITNLDRDKSTLRISFILIFLLALMIRIWFNFFDNHIHAAFACDAAEYMRDAQNLAFCGRELFSGNCENCFRSLHVLFGQASASDIKSTKDLFAVLKEMSISGPAYPLFLLAAYKIFGQNPSMDVWMIPILLQSILCALTCALIASIAGMSWGRKESIAAGLLAAFYPGFIVNSGRLYSESFACFLLCFILWLMCSFFIEGRNNIGWGFLLGVSLFALQVTRSLMSVLTIFTIVVFILFSSFVAGRRRQMLRYLFATAFGFVLCLLPWLALQKLALGKTALIVDRCGNYNLFVGNDVSGQGYLSIPYPDLSGTDTARPWQILRQSIKRNPAGWFKLALDKPVRLLKLPWNDFKVWLGPINPSYQAMFHQLVLIFACTGIVLGKDNTGEKWTRQKILLRCLILFSLLLHFTYCAFITIPRYNLTAMPALILFAAAGIINIFDRVNSKRSFLAAGGLLGMVLIVMFISRINIVKFLPAHSNSFILTDCFLCADVLMRTGAMCSLFIAAWRLLAISAGRTRTRVSLAVLLIVGFLTMPAYCLPLRGHGRWYEWRQDFSSANGQIEKTISLNRDQHKKLIHNGAYLAAYLAGGENLPVDWEISVNGIKLNGPFIPAMSMAQDLSLVRINSPGEMTVEQEWIINHLCGLSSSKVLDLRQWFLIPVEGLQWQKILRDYEYGQKESPVELNITIKSKAGSGGIIYGAYPFSSRYALMPSLFRCSWEKCFYGVENDYSVNDPIYDQSLKLEKMQLTKTMPAASCPGAYVKLLLPTSKELLRLVEKKSLQSDFSLNNATLNFKSLSFSKAREGYWLIRMSGDTKKEICTNIHPWASLNFASPEEKGSYKKYFYRPVWATTSLKPEAEVNSPRKFDLSFPVLLNAFPAQLQDIVLHLDAESDAAAGGNKQGGSSASSDYVRCYLRIYQFTRLPSGMSYEIL
jgi:4-amino-4-deoxy-L-arabinose transferase-like glycosyltransferase